MKILLAFLLLSAACSAQQVASEVHKSDTTNLDYTRDYGASIEEVPPRHMIIDSLRRVIDQTAPEGSWDDERVPITSVRVPGTGAPGWTQVYETGGSMGVGLYCFDDANEESVFFTLQIPHNWQGTVNGYDSSLNFHVHWLHAGADTGKVVWGLEYTWASIAVAGVPPAATVFGTTNIVYSGEYPIIGNAVKDYHQLSAFPPIIKADQRWSSMLICRLFRYTGDIDGDVNTSDACVLEVDCHILKRPRGTTSIYNDN